MTSGLFSMSVRNSVSHCLNILAIWVSPVLFVVSVDIQFHPCAGKACRLFESLFLPLTITRFALFKQRQPFFTQGLLFLCFFQIQGLSHRYNMFSVAIKFR